MWNVVISHDGTPVKVTPSGELVVAPLEYSKAKFLFLNVVDTAFNFYTPEPNSQFVITGFNMKADRNVSQTTDASVIIYEGDSDTDTTAAEADILFQEAMIRGERTGYTNTNLLVSEGRWVNAKTTDANIPLTIMGYYIKAL
jgi:hypothetical protein